MLFLLRVDVASIRCPVLLAASGKVFVIGLSKTGTSSLRQALKFLGYRVFKADMALPPGDDFDAATHEYVAANFELLDRRYPGSKFIYTVRSKDGWLDSVYRHWRTHEKRRIADRKMLTLLYGLPNWGFDPEIFSAAYERHHARVMNYFLGRPRDLLVMNVCAGDGWGALSPFLGVPTPDAPFPHALRGVGSIWYYVRPLVQLHPLKFLRRIGAIAPKSPAAIPPVTRPREDTSRSSRRS
jgi:hypothetical protein